MFFQKLQKVFSKISPFEYFLFSIFLIFSSFLMWKTFRLDAQGNMMIASKAWSDFAATIPLIRSFSFGSNWPPEYPIFAGYPIRYHFIFFWLVGCLEKIGLPISWALNLPSIIGFTALLIAIYYLGKIVFKSKAVGIISVLLFLFNGSFSFLEFFRSHQLSSKTLGDIINSTSFASFGPYDNKIVSAFWNLNIFTNQRHLALGYAVFIYVLIYLYIKSQSKNPISILMIIFLGFTIGLFPFVHYPVFGMLIMLLALFFLFFANLRKQIFFIGLIAIILGVPQILYMGESVTQVKLFQPGYLIRNLTTINFLNYWLMNLGLTSILAPIGFLIATKEQRKMFIPFLALFVVGSLFKFSPEIAANHKFFNLFVIGLNTFTAFLLTKLWKKSIVLKPVVIILIFFLTLSGLFDIFPIVNDHLIPIEDIPNNKIATYIKENTPKTAVLLNSSFLYHPASLAGRKILMGWPYFPWSAGYDTDTRGKLMHKIYESTSKTEICSLLIQNNVDYFTVQDTSNDNDFPKINLVYFSQNFEFEYYTPTVSLINVSRNCTP